MDYDGSKANRSLGNKKKMGNPRINVDMQESGNFCCQNGHIYCKAAGQ